MGIVIDYMPPSNKNFSGGYVAEPNPGKYPYVITLDFTSLYPSIMMAYNISPNTYLKKGQDIGLVKGKDYEEILCPIIEEKTGNVIGENVHRFLKPDIRKGYLALLVENLINERKKIKRLMIPGMESTVEYKMYNARQLGLKIAANSVYGGMGVREAGILPFMEGAESVTAVGRDKIIYCNKYLEEKYKATIIYNDTDSTMFTLSDINDYKSAIKWGHILEKELTQMMPKPMALEFEKTGKMLCIKKKKYAFWLADSNLKIKNSNNDYVENPKYGNLKDYIEDQDNIITRGIVLARRDNCKLLRAVYRELMQNILSDSPMKEVLSYLMKEMIKLYLGCVEWGNLLIIRSMGAHYKSDNYFMKVFGDELKKLGLPSNPGDRLEYLIIKSNDDLLGMKLRLPETYIERKNTNIEEIPDYRYYIEKLFMKSLEQLWYIGFRKELDELEQQYILEDSVSIIQEMINSSKDNGISIINLWNQYNGDPHKVIEILSTDKKYNNKYTIAKRKYISGRNVFKSRISKNPIKKLLKAIDMGKLKEYAKIIKK